MSGKENEFKVTKKTSFKWVSKLKDNIVSIISQAIVVFFSK